MRTAHLSLWEILDRLPDVRGLQGRRHPLKSILGLVLVATMAGMKSLEAIAQFGRDQGPSLAFALGFLRSKTPCKSTLSVVLRSVDVAALERLLAEWAAQGDAAEAIAIDGKTLRGSRDGELPAVHLLCGFAAASSRVLGQSPVDATTNEHKKSLQLLGVLPLEGAVVTGDAMFCHRDFCGEVRRGGGDYLVTVKDNQQTLKADATLALALPEGLSPLRPAPA